MKKSVVIFSLNPLDADPCKSRQSPMGEHTFIHRKRRNTKSRHCIATDNLYDFTFQMGVPLIYTSLHYCKRSWKLLFNGLQTIDCESFVFNFWWFWFDYFDANLSLFRIAICKFAYLKKDMYCKTFLCIQGCSNWCIAEVKKHIKYVHYLFYVRNAAPQRKNAICAFRSHAEYFLLTWKIPSYSLSA